MFSVHILLFGPFIVLLIFACGDLELIVFIRVNLCSCGLNMHERSKAFFKLCNSSYRAGLKGRQLPRAPVLRGPPWLQN